MRRFVLLAALTLVGTAGCERTTAPAVSLVYSRAPNTSGVVTSSTYLSPGPTPGGFSAGSYDVWFAIPPDTVANAGVQVAISIPVFLSRHGVLRPASASSIAPADTLLIWTDGSSAIGSSQSPPGTPCYIATQIVIVR